MGKEIATYSVFLSRHQPLPLVILLLFWSGSQPQSVSTDTPDMLQTFIKCN